MAVEEEQVRLGIDPVPFTLGKHEAEIAALKSSAKASEERMEARINALDDKVDSVEAKVDSLAEKVEDHCTKSDGAFVRLEAKVDLLVTDAANRAPIDQWGRGAMAREQAVAAALVEHKRSTDLRLNTLFPILAAFGVNQTGVFDALFPHTYLVVFHAVVFAAAALGALALTARRPRIA